jgi:nucleotide-binding universal stress UspA family protein
MKKICFPTDFSERSLKALVAAVKMAGKFKAELHVIHVIASGIDLKIEKDVLEDLKQKAVEEKFKELQNQFSSKNLKLHFTALRGNAFKEIKKYALHNEIDFCFLSTHGYSGLKRLFMGSLTAQLFQNSSLKLFTLNPGALEDFDVDKIKNICFPTDFSEISQKSLDLAVNFALTLKIPLNLLHVFTDYREWLAIYGDVYSLSGNYASFQEFYDERKKHAEEQLDLLSRKLKSLHPELTVNVDLQEGDAEKVIVEQINFDLEQIIVMATHGYKGMEHFLMGSVAERIVQTANAAVLLYNPAFKEKESDGIS